MWNARCLPLRSVGSFRSAEGRAKPTECGLQGRKERKQYVNCRERDVKFRQDLLKVDFLLMKQKTHDHPLQVAVGRFVARLWITS
jgi:hypothetical protein